MSSGGFQRPEFFDSLPEVEEYCRDAVSKVPRLNCEVFDSRRRQLDFTGAVYFRAQVLLPSSWLPEE